MNISPEEFKKKILANEHLPSGLVVNGLWLDECTSLIHLPSGLVVHGDLWLYNCTSLTHLHSGLVVHGDLWLNGCTSLPHLPPGLVVKGNLNLYNCTSLTHLPSGLVVEGTVYCDESLINKIPREDLPLYLNFKFEEKIHEYFTRRIQKENIS